MTANTTELMGAVDRAWFEMDEPGNPMVIAALFEMQGPVDAAAFQKSVIERLLRYPRFHQRVDVQHALPRWVRETQLDFRYHVQVRRLPASGFESALGRAVSGEMARELDRAKPLWRVLIFPRAGGPVSILFRAHHAIADGVALMTLLVDSTDAGLVRLPVLNSGAGRPARGGPLGGFIDRLEDLNAGLERLRQTWRRARRHPEVAREQIQLGRETLAAVGRVLRLPEDNPSSYRLPLSGVRGVAWAHELELQPLREFARSRGVRVNDVLTTALAGAFRHDLRCRGVTVEAAQNLRVSIPVNMRQGRGRELGNRFGLILLDLPIGIHDMDQRLAAVSARLAELKASPEARATLMGLEAAGHLPVPIEKKLVGKISAKSAAVVSNLPGPKRSVTIAGASLRNLVFWPPQAGGIGIGVSFFSYAGRVSIGVSADAAMLPDPRRFIEGFLAEIAALQGQKPGVGSLDRTSPLPTRAAALG